MPALNIYMFGFWPSTIKMIGRVNDCSIKCTYILYNYLLRFTGCCGYGFGVVKDMKTILNLEDIWPSPAYICFFNKLPWGTTTPGCNATSYTLIIASNY